MKQTWRSWGAYGWKFILILVIGCRDVARNQLHHDCKTVTVATGESVLFIFETRQVRYVLVEWNIPYKFLTVVHKPITVKCHGVKAFPKWLLSLLSDIICESGEIWHLSVFALLIRYIWYSFICQMSTVLNHATHSYQNSVIFADKKTAICRILCFVKEAYRSLFSFQKVVNKACCF